MVIYKAGFYKFIIKVKYLQCQREKLQQNSKKKNDANCISNELTPENSANYLGTQYSDKIFSV